MPDLLLVGVVLREGGEIILSWPRMRVSCLGRIAMKIFERVVGVNGVGLYRLL
jgi:hypothetical protein